MSGADPGIAVRGGHPFLPLPPLPLHLLSSFPSLPSLPPFPFPQIQLGGLGSTVNDSYAG